MKTSVVCLGAMVTFVAACAPVRAPESSSAVYDLVIAGGTIVDGTGAPGYRADIGIVGDRIALVSRQPIAPSRGRRIIDATGLVIAPGFIDLHAHLDPLL